MRTVLIISLTLLFYSCASGKDRTFTGSTPAGREVRSFLGMPLSDSVDFIRWKIVINDIRFSLQCNYGIGKPNTNGFYHGGKKTSIEGKVERKGNHHRLLYRDSFLDLYELNENLLHVGNGGGIML